MNSATPRLRYDSLWHLTALGVLTRENMPNTWLPEDVKKPARVALIDTSVAMDHPNLRGAINQKLAFDLFSTRLGAFPGLLGQTCLGELGLGTAQAVVAGLPGCQALLDALDARLGPDQPPCIGTIQPATSSVFSGHGTAIAGLIGARPVVVPMAEAYRDDPRDTTLALPYCGVDPTCEIIPISTNFDTDPEQMILAFLYAERIKADVIVLPRGIPDPFRMQPELYAHDLGGRNLGELTAPCPISDEARALWAELAELIVKISLRRPIVCAAGNENEEYGIYPANLASEDNGVISVGAVNAKGWACSYSPPSGLTVWGPSTDAESFVEGDVRLDMSRHRADTRGVPRENNTARFSHFEIISTDVPGQGGYSASPYDGAEPEDGLREFGSFFCRFGGTSAASAIIGGLLALGRGLGKIPVDADGVDAKAWLLQSCVTPVANQPNVCVPCLDGLGAFPVDSTP